MPLRLPRRRPRRAPVSPPPPRRGGAGRGRRRELRLGARGHADGLESARSGRRRWWWWWWWWSASQLAGGDAGSNATVWRRRVAPACLKAIFISLAAQIAGVGLRRQEGGGRGDGVDSRYEIAFISGMQQPHAFVRGLLAPPPPPSPFIPFLPLFFLLGMGTTPTRHNKNH